MVVFTHGSFEVLNKHPNCCVCKLTCAISILYSKQTHGTAFASLWHCNEKTSLLPKLVWPDQFWQPKLVPHCQFRSPSENVNSKQSKVAS